ncbi:hypothetical protein [Nocardioides sp. Root140]|uniref:hypothetical protein n=1 Tax=Nocardioides sp. Root140 TaxID=1736460 RepID=UPI0006FF896A|nr:hypothetical protein [Nocardioides sp. Root140]KQY64039.1 hypothetical protein ASD30_03470 [Nocardioides sp. Root140]
MTAETSHPEGLRPVDLIGAAVLAVAMLGPVLFHRGYALRGDMIFTPDQPWKDAWLGLDGAVPRFVPGDAIVWLLSQMVSGDLVQKMVLVGALLAGALGIARLVGNLSGVARFAAMLVYLWNPWVFERLSIGQWPMVVGYLLLPWLLLASLQLTGSPGPTRRDGAVFFVLMGLSAACAPAAGLLACALSGVVLVVGGARSTVFLGWAATGLLVNLPWIVPSLVATESLTATDGQFTAFAAKGESPLGTLASVLTLGGIWKTSVVPQERTVPVVVLLSLALTLVAVWSTWRSRHTSPVLVRSLLVVGAAAVLVAALPSVGPVADALDTAGLHLPSLGLLRDSQRYLGPAALVIAFGLAHAVHALRVRAVPGREAFVIAAGALAMVPVAALPSMAWGLSGDLEPVRYPQEWTEVAESWPAADPDDGAVVVLPWHGGYRGFEWNALRAMLDPAPRFFPGEVLIDDRHFLGSAVLDSEDDRLAGVAAALESPDPAGELRALGVRWVLVEKHNGHPMVPRGNVVHDGEWLRLVDLGAPPASDGRRSVEGPGSARRTVVIAAVTLAAASWFAAICVILGSGMYRVRHKREMVREEL